MGDEGFYVLIQGLQNDELIWNISLDLSNNNLTNDSIRFLLNNLRFQKPAETTKCQTHGQDMVASDEVFKIRSLNLSKNNLKSERD